MQLMQLCPTDVTMLRNKPVLRAPVTSAIWTADTSYSYQLNAKCQDFITRYLRQSLCNPDDPNMAHVNRGLLALAFTVSTPIAMDLIICSWLECGFEKYASAM